MEALALWWCLRVSSVRQFTVHTAFVTWCQRRDIPASMTNRDEPPITAWDGRAGESFRDYRDRLQEYLACKTDKSGSSVADYLDGMDLGGPHPQAPGYANMTPAVTGEMQRLRVARANQAHSIILQTIGLADIKTTLRRTFARQQALDMWLHLIAAYDAPLLTSEQDAIRIKMLSLSIACDIGYDTDTIQRFAARLQVLNGKLDPAGQLDQTGLAERVLTAIINASQFLHTPALDELNAAPILRKYMVRALPGGLPNPLIGQRDLPAIVRQFGAQWKAAVDAGHIPKRAAQSSALRPASANVARALSAAGIADVDVPSEDVEDGYTQAHVVDSVLIATSELICDNCRGGGHKKAECPSAQRYRSFQYAIALLESARRRADARGPAARGPPRGQRPPFTQGRAPFRRDPRAPARQPVRFGAAHVAEEGDEDNAVEHDEPNADAEDGAGNHDAPGMAATVTAVMPLTLDDYFEDEYAQAASAITLLPPAAAWYASRTVAGLGAFVCIALAAAFAAAEHLASVVLYAVDATKSVTVEVALILAVGVTPAAILCAALALWARPVNGFAFCHLPLQT